MDNFKNENLKAEIVTSVLSGVKNLLDTKFDSALNEGLIEEKPMTSAETMKFLGISKATLQRRVDSREIPFHRGSGKRSRLYFYKSEINQYYKNGKVKTRKELGLDGEVFTNGLG